jgi:ABC-type branched-subunit amino acid transport system permease subunit
MLQLEPAYWFPGSSFYPHCSQLFSCVRCVVRRTDLAAPRRLFSLLTLALTALLFAITYRWTEFTGGESGLGGVTRDGIGPILSATAIIIGWLPPSRWLCFCCALSSVAGWQRAFGDP